MSLKTGQSVLQGLSSDRYDLKDILIDKDGNWHMRGFPVKPMSVLDQVDVVFVALHGAYGEDGSVQHLLEAHNISYTGSDALSSAIAMNKVLTKKCLKDVPFKHVPYRLLSKEKLTKRMIIDLFQTFPQPSVVKPVSGGSSVATVVVTSFDELLYALVFAFEQSDKVLVEKYIKGREATVAVSDMFRGEELYSFPPVEIVTTEDKFFDYDEKYGGEACELCPAPFEARTTKALIESAKHVHKVIGLRDYSRSDFIVAKDGIYFLEVNSLPGLTSESLVPKSVEAVGATLPQFLEHLVERARVR